MNELSTLRLYLLHAGYLLLVLGLGSIIWPRILHHGSWELMHGVVTCMLGAMSALALLGLRYPVCMLLLLFFELAWKSIWLITVAAPLWTTHQMDADTTETAFECLMAVIFVAVIPWPYVVKTYLAKPGDRWGRRPAPQA